MHPKKQNYNNNNKQQQQNHQIADDSDFARFRNLFKWKKCSLQRNNQFTWPSLSSLSSTIISSIINTKCQLRSVCSTIHTCLTEMSKWNNKHRQQNIYILLNPGIVVFWKIENQQQFWDQEFSCKILNKT